MHVIVSFETLKLIDTKFYLNKNILYCDQIKVKFNKFK